MKLRYGRLQFGELVDDTIDRTLRFELTGDEFDALTAMQLTEMSADLQQRLLDVIEDYDLQVPDPGDLAA